MSKLNLDKVAGGVLESIVNNGDGTKTANFSVDSKTGQSGASEFATGLQQAGNTDLKIGGFKSQIGNHGKVSYLGNETVTWKD